MKTKRTFQLIAACGAFLTLLPATGCMTGGGLAKVVKALSQDQARFDLTATGYGVNIVIHRENTNAVPPKP